MKYATLLSLSLLLFSSCERTKHMYKPNKFPTPFTYSITDSTIAENADPYAKAVKWLKKKTDLNDFTFDSTAKKSDHITAKGTITFKTHKALVMVNREKITYNIDITITGNKYTCKLSNFEHRSNGVKNGNSYKYEKPKYFDYSFGSLSQLDPTKSADNRRWDKIKNESEYDAKKILRSLKNAMMR